jgi:mannitol/fructose-specific phosphotransferase system IIA component (Ntr-type)
MTSANTTIINNPSNIEQLKNKDKEEELIRLLERKKVENTIFFF